METAPSNVDPVERDVPTLEARNIHISYGPVSALSGVNVRVMPGEVLALVGDNGAGKSTLLSVLSGVRRPDKGELYVGGQQVFFHSPIEARTMGIETVYQDLALPPHLEIGDAMFLGREVLRKDIWGKFGALDRKTMRIQSKEHLDALGISINSIRQTVGELSGGQRQAIAVARAVAWSSRLILLDEPTAALGVEETSKVLELVKRLKRRGIAVVLVSHTMPHVLEVSDRILVLRQGHQVIMADTKSATVDKLVKWITTGSGEVS